MDLTTLRAQFPVCERWIYLNHAGVAPISVPVQRAVQEHVDDVLHNGIVHIARHHEVVREARERCAALLSASPDEIAFVKNTGEGVSIVANGLTLGPADTVLLPAGEFPANHRPWKRQEARGARVVLVESKTGFVSTSEVIEACERYRPSVLALSWVGFHHGYRHDLVQLGTWCQAHETFFFVDAIQGLGIHPLDVNRCGISALAADAHKWLLGPEGIGLLYVSAPWQERVVPLELGWANTARPLDFFALDQPLAATARRYECGTLCTAAIYGLSAAVKLLLDVGLREVERQVLLLTDALREAIGARGYRLTADLPSPNRSGIVNFAADDPGQTSALHRALQQARVVHTFRGGHIRLSPHAYNTLGEIEQVRALL